MLYVAARHNVSTIQHFVSYRCIVALVISSYIFCDEDIYIILVEVENITVYLYC